MIAAGTGIALTANSRVCTQSNRPGDKIVATVTSAVTGSNGAVIPAGSKVVLEIVSVNPGQGPETLVAERGGADPFCCVSEALSHAAGVPRGSSTSRRSGVSGGWRACPRHVRGPDADRRYSD